MKKLKSITEMIQKLSNYETFANRVELKRLPDILSKSEHILLITTATYQNTNGLLVATDERILFLEEDKDPPLFGLEYEDIDYVYHHLNDTVGEMELFLAQRKIQLSDISKNDIQPLLKIVDPHFLYHKEELHEEKNKSWLPFVVTFSFVLVIMAGIVQDYFYHDKPFENNQPVSVETAQSEYDLFFSTLEIYPIDDLNFLKGEITNHSQKEYTSILIDIAYYDKNGNQKETAKKRINHLKPEQTWSFKEDFQSKEIVDFKITGIKVQTLAQK